MDRGVGFDNTTLPDGRQARNLLAIREGKPVRKMVNVNTGTIYLHSHPVT